MNIFRKVYCRTYQGVFKLAIPFLPYREPKILDDNAGVVKVLKDSGFNSVLLVTDKGISGLGLINPLVIELKSNNIQVTIFDETVANPTTNNVESGVKCYLANNCQALIAFGGGSAMDCAKGIGARIACPNKPLSKMKGVLKVGKAIPTLIAVPTTAGTGSETTLACVITDSETRHKYAINDFPLIPKYALLDASLTIGLPKHITSTTGMDALTHSIEAFIGKSTTKDTRANALESVKLIFENLLPAYENGKNITVRKNMLKASYLAGLAFTKSYVGYVHAIAHSLGGKYNTPHGLANAIILPIMLRQYGKCVHKKLWELGLYAGLFDKNTSIQDGAEIFIKTIEDLNKKMDIPNHIDSLKIEDIDELSTTAEKEANPLYPVPKLMDKEQLKFIYDKLTKTAKK